MADEYLDEKIYKGWLEDIENHVEGMSLEQIESKILEVQHGTFHLKVAARILYEKRDKLKGRAWGENSREISDPNFKINYEAKEKVSKPKVSKEEKDDNLMKAAGVDVAAMKLMIKQKLAEKAKEKK